MKNAAMAQVVEHILGKDEVGSSSLPSSSKEKALALQVLFLFSDVLHGVKIILYRRGDLRYMICFSIRAFSPLV